MDNVGTSYLGSKIYCCINFSKLVIETSLAVDGWNLCTHSVNRLQTWLRYCQDEPVYYLSTL